MEMLDTDLFPLFKETVYYAKLAAVMTGNIDVGKVMGRKVKKKLSLTTIQDLELFAEQRQYQNDPAAKFQDFRNVLDDRLGQFYFKKVGGLATRISAYIHFPFEFSCFCFPSFLAFFSFICGHYNTITKVQDVAQLKLSFSSAVNTSKRNPSFSG